MMRGRPEPVLGDKVVRVKPRPSKLAVLFAPCKKLRQSPLVVCPFILPALDNSGEVPDRQAYIIYRPAFFQIEIYSLDNIGHQLAVCFPLACILTGIPRIKDLLII